MQPIPTEYAGHSFRSRLEARWAVFFDSLLEMPWHYEPEGFQLTSRRYLPDFWLPTLRMWVEIKSTTPSSFELSQLAEFASWQRELGNWYMILANGEIPYEPDGGIRALGFNSGGFNDVRWIPVGILETYRALDAARCARFEYGETGHKREQIIWEAADYKLREAASWHRDVLEGFISLGNIPARYRDIDSIRKEVSKIHAQMIRKNRL